MSEPLSDGVRKQTMTLLGESFVFLTDEPVDLVERAISSVRERAVHISQSAPDNRRVVVMCAVQLALELERVREQLAVYREKEAALARLAERVHTLG